MNAISEINEATAQEYFSRLDALVEPGTELYVIGGSAIALLGAKIRTTAGVDVALPCSKLDIAAFGEASAKAGLPVNPAFGYQGAYIELVQPLMLTLPKPKSEESAIPDDELTALDEAAMLHLPLPQGGYASVRALYRLAAYQAGSCDYGMRGFIDNVRRRLNRPALAVTEVPSGMVKDVVLPKYRVPEF